MIASSTQAAVAVKICACQKFWMKPDRIRLPKPPYPTSAPMVTMPTVETVAIRMPARIVGRASGTSIRQSTVAVPIPIPRAASNTSGSTSSSPTTVLRSTTSSA